MKAITIKQPWATLICTPRRDNPKLGIKDIENRTWPCPKKYIGERVLIHAGMYRTLMNVIPSTFLTENQIEIIDNESVKFKKEDWNLYGCIIGSVEIIGCVIDYDSIWAEKTNIMRGDKPIYNWILANPIMFNEPIPAKGKLSFWDFTL